MSLPASTDLPAQLERLSRLHPKLIDLSLDRVRALLRKLGDPHLRLAPVIHVAGTNGKGSTLAFMRAMAERAGLTAHVFTSPHLVRINERFRLAGQLIEDSDLATLLDRVEAANEGAPITQFEVLTAAGFLAMAERPADLCLIEVGLGGRLDATNVIERPAVTVITPIGIDHAEFLGDTLTAIAGEKAGIIKQGAPVICGQTAPEAAHVIEARAKEVGAKYVPVSVKPLGDGGFLARAPLEPDLHLPAPGLLGPHQMLNAAMAAFAIANLAMPIIDDAAIAAGVKKADWPGRLQALADGPLTQEALAGGVKVWLDGAHNPHGAQALAAALAQRPARRTVFILGMKANKDAAGFFEALTPISRQAFTVQTPDQPSAMAAEILAERAREGGFTASPVDSVAEAMARAVEAGAERIVIAGSLYLAGHVLALNGQIPR